MTESVLHAARLRASFDRLRDPWLWEAGPPADPLAARDPAFIEAELDNIAFWVERYHESTVEGLERVVDGPALVVGNHNGGMMAPDMFALMVAWWRRRGTHEPAHGLMHDFVFRVPPFGRYLARMGAVPARPALASEALGRGAKVLVYPGGDLDAFRPSSRKHEIVFGQRRGFVRVALRAGVPIVPVVSIGAHDGLHVFTDGADFARRSGLKRWLRIEVFPIAAGLPWGIWAGPMMYWPLPVRMKLRVLDPIAWPHLEPDAADDAAIVLRCREEVREAMQQALHSMAREPGWGRKPLFG